MNSKLESHLKKTVANGISLNNIKKKGKIVLLDYSVKGSIDNKSLRLVLVIDEKLTSVRRGENKKQDP